MAKYGLLVLVEASAAVGSRLVTMDTLVVGLGSDWKFSMRMLVGVPMIRADRVSAVVLEVVVVTVVVLRSISHPWRT